MYRVICSLILLAGFTAGGYALYEVGRDLDQATAALNTASDQVTDAKQSLAYHTAQVRGLLNVIDLNRGSVQAVREQCVALKHLSTLHEDALAKYDMALRRNNNLIQVLQAYQHRFDDYEVIIDRLVAALVENGIEVPVLPEPPETN